MMIATRTMPNVQHLLNVFLEGGKRRGGGGGGARSRFTENKTVLSQSTKNNIGISRFTQKKGKVFL